ncbi:hypothetical protein LTS08_002458 [Lithohypha guttulata]|uniref:Uncharacterized protein n=1 Tax=Lithohypha guttulata TaxID=1690604 RepID=A0AAN7YJP1_9EURO|nr:hypothetical protein LTR51_004021 [Lithohypha guttulata]KAK5090633.1 hypothetical protein LTR05_000808 [Lithohypha guttulata]KAK5104567.1 hypothetical protein LTS08_002458 [Lithohypha guttulata]
MFLKQYNYKPKTGSASSASADQQPAQTAPANTNDQPFSAANAGRRRSSGQYSGLNGYKRTSGEERRTSIQDQSKDGGVLGNMWNNFTKGGK